ncbi:lysophospholipid acyltransferase family protein [Nitrosomonas ureae]|uniref:Lyso-ornithine lipid acyltransferase n=1 Tax=Nitrosomonas ureae TaxID=44577 RepID=A0A0S3AI77_9PROT|nr:lysophospholipid acyltransferase family protein [Nitrosomonas ureae]ALQ50867.1 glycerol acyltransferase [Nitrosomonas ureae]PTQ79856.1 lyso-ornithine lipid acyltransferase [Nitrosomonas ureae]PXX16602.1 lyso-ornithine lipid acyltransferase [Nitrosomonas ureae]SDT85581.1 lyso-ornithine lipid acyltransferase [Nitrosomonas ureae]SOD18888.1 lyso-ornithine lipid acyltransferase [Nitrosomonas ureae]
MQKNTPLLLRFIRLIRLLFHVVSGLLQSVVYPYFPLPIQRKLMQRWASGLLSVLEIRLQCHGRLPTAEIPCVLLVANHVSWLDVCVLMAVCPTRFVAKAEINRWPILGRLSRNVGTLFIERAKRADTLRINQQISEVLERGERVTVFPEGTTTDGTHLNHFHASLLQSAVITDALLYPVAIGYRNSAGEICQEAAYIESSLVLSLQKILSQTRIDAELTFNLPTSCGTKNRRELARLSEQAIADTLSLPIAHKKVEKLSDLPGE